MERILPIDLESLKLLQNVDYYNPGGFQGREQSVYKLIERIDNLPSTEHISAKAVAFICGYSAVLGHPFVVVSHRPSHTMDEKRDILSNDGANVLSELGIDQRDVSLLKTFTMQVRHEGTPQHFLVAGIGDFKINRQVKRALSPAVKRTLKTETNLLNKGLIINPPDFKPTTSLGVEAGIVSPFIILESKPDEPDVSLAGVLYLHDERIYDRGYVAVAVSLTDTLLVDGSVFPGILNFWQERNSSVPFRMCDLEQGAI